ncbi:MAG: hypothetical protein M3Y91_12950 [Actinomycetota bacterium]|nr:hypothetical protein [Actinomycetota bacterium]
MAEPDSILSGGRGYGAAANAAHEQAYRLVRANAHLSAAAFAGPAGDKARALLDQLHGATTAAAQAFDRVASEMPRVAHAIEEAQTDEKAAQRTERLYQAAKTAETGAQTTMTQATAALSAAQSAAASPNPAIAALAHTTVPIAEKTCQDAQHKLHQAQVKLHQADLDHRRALRRFEEAQQHANTVRNAFALLCAQETPAAGCTLPGLWTPGPSLDPSSPLGMASSLLGMAKLSTTARADMNAMVHSGGRDNPGTLLHQTNENLGTLGVLQSLFKVLGDGAGSLLVGDTANTVTAEDHASSSSDKALAMVDQAAMAAAVAGVPGAGLIAQGVEGLQTGTFLDAHGCHPTVVPVKPTDVHPDNSPPPAPSMVDQAVAAYRALPAPVQILAPPVVAAGLVLSLPEDAVAAGVGFVASLL